MRVQKFRKNSKYNIVERDAHLLIILLKELEQPWRAESLREAKRSTPKESRKRFNSEEMNGVENIFARRYSESPADPRKGTASRELPTGKRSAFSDLKLQSGGS